MKSKKKMVKQVFKLFGISLGLVVGAVGVVTGIMFVAGVFKQPNVPLTDMYFRVNNMGDSNNNQFFIDNSVDENGINNTKFRVMSIPNNSTELDFKLTINNTPVNGEFEINADINLSIQDGKAIVNNQEFELNRDGTLKMQAQRQLVDCECTIFVDTLVENYSLKLVDKSGDQIFVGENNNTFVKYVLDSNGNYFYDEEQKEYLLIENMNNFVGERYSKQENKIYPSQKDYFYVEIDNVEPSNAFKTYSNIEATRLFKTFNVEASSENSKVVSTAMEMFNGKPRVKITIERDGEFSITSSLINSYNNMLLKASLDKKKAENYWQGKDDEIFEEEYTNVIKSFTINSDNNFNIKVNDMEIVGINVDKKDLQVEVGKTYNYTSQNIADNINGLGITLKAPSNSDYTSEQLKSELAKVKVQTGYYENSLEENIILSETYISATTSIDTDYNLQINLTCYAQKNDENFNNLLILSIGEYSAIINVKITKKENPSLQLSNNNNDIEKTLTVTDKVEEYDLTTIQIVDSKTNKPVNLNNVRYVVWDNSRNEIDTNNQIIKNDKGIVGVYEYVKDYSGKFGYYNNEYVLIEDIIKAEGEYNGERYSYNFIQKVVSTGTEFGRVVIRAIIIKQDYSGNMVCYNVDPNGEYGYFRGQYMPISEIKSQFDFDYVGTKYSLGNYEREGSPTLNSIILTVEQPLRIVDFDLVEKQTNNDGVEYNSIIGISEDGLVAERISPNKIKLTIDEGKSNELFLKIDSVDNLKMMEAYQKGKLVIDYIDSFVRVDVLREYDLVNHNFGFSIYAKSATKLTSVAIRILDENNNVVNDQEFILELVINKVDLEEITVKCNNQLDEVTIKPLVDRNNVFWQTDSGETINFEFGYAHKNADIEFECLEFVYYIDKENKTEDNSIITLSFNEDYSQIEYKILKKGTVYVGLKYQNEITNKYLESNLLKIVVDVEDIQVTYSQDGNNGQTKETAVQMLDYDLMQQEQSISSFVTIEYQGTSLEDALKQFEIINVLDKTGNVVNSDLLKNYCTINGCNIKATDSSKYLSEEIIVQIKIKTVFGGTVASGEDCFLFVRIIPDVTFKAVSDDTSLTKNENGTYTLTMVQGSIVKLTELFSIKNSNNEDYEILNCSTSSYSNMPIERVDSYTNYNISFNVISENNELTITLKTGFKIKVIVNIIAE